MCITRKNPIFCVYSVTTHLFFCFYDSQYMSHTFDPAPSNPARLDSLHLTTPVFLKHLATLLKEQVTRLNVI